MQIKHKKSIPIVVILLCHNDCFIRFKNVFINGVIILHYKCNFITSSYVGISYKLHTRTIITS